MDLGSKMVAVGWQVSALHRSAFHLGLIGLLEFLPLPLLAPWAGHLLTASRAARSSPRRSRSASPSPPAGLLAVSLTASALPWPYLLAGAAAALGTPAARALPPMLVPLDPIESAMALRSIAFQVGFAGGPAIGGLRFAAVPSSRTERPPSCSPSASPR